MHLSIWHTEKRTLLTLLDTPRLTAAREAALRRELTDVDTVIFATDKDQP